MTLHIAERVRTIRKQRGVKSRVLGEVLEVTPQQMSRLEKGKNKFSGEQLYRVARALDVPVSAFYLGYQENREELGRLRIVLKGMNDQWQPAAEEEQERILLEGWRRLSDNDQRGAVLSVLQAISPSTKKK